MPISAWIRSGRKLSDYGRRVNSSLESGIGHMARMKISFKTLNNSINLAFARSGNRDKNPSKPGPANDRPM